MDAAFLHGVGDIRIGQIAVPRPEADEVLLKVRAVGICGSDLHCYVDGGTDGSAWGAPLILGHEIAAEVVDDGSVHVGLAAGSLVAVDPGRSCGHCEWCRRGHANLCPNVVFAGSPPETHGALCEYITAPLANLYAVPEGFSPSDAAILELLGVAIHSLDLAALQPGETALVLGAGPLGLLLAQLSRHLGAGSVFVVDPLTYRGAVAGELGVDGVAATHDAVTEWTDGRGVDLVLEATNSAVALQQAAECVRIGGRLILAGIPGHDLVSVSASLVRRKGLTLKVVRRMAPGVYPRAIQLVSTGAINLKPLATHSFSLQQTAAAFDLQANHRDGVIKSVIEL